MTKKSLELDIIDLAHEVGHQVLILYTLSDPIISEGENELVYSGARKEYRNAFRALHSAIALCYMIEAASYFQHNEEISIKIRNGN